MEKIILSGAEILLEQTGKFKEIYRNKNYCENESQILKDFNDSLKLETNDVCALNNRLSNSFSDGFSLINIEPIIDCASCLKFAIEVILKNCEFRYFYSFQEKDNALRSLISVQRLKFSVRIENSSFEKSSLPEGFISSLKEEIHIQNRHIY